MRRAVLLGVLAGVGALVMVTVLGVGLYTCLAWLGIVS